MQGQMSSALRGYGGACLARAGSVPKGSSRRRLSRLSCPRNSRQSAILLEFGERLDLVLWETCHIYATCQAYRAEADFQHSPISKRAEYAGPNGPNGPKP